MAQKHIVGGGLETRQVFERDEGNVIEKSPKYTYSHLGEDEDGDLLPHPRVHPCLSTGPNCGYRPEAQPPPDTRMTVCGLVDGMMGGGNGGGHNICTL